MQGCGWGEQRSSKNVDGTRDSNARIEVKGVMKLDIGESICIQPGMITRQNSVHSASTSFLELVAS